MRDYVSKKLRLQVATKAAFLCEYCLISEDDTIYGCQVDHIISIKHGGKTVSENLAYACIFCNRNKGSDIGSILWPNQKFIRFFNPRTDRWADHFKLDGTVIRPKTDTGKVTTQILGFNHADRILERQILIANKSYPSQAATTLILNQT